MTRRPPYLRVVGPNERPPPELGEVRPVGEDDAALILRDVHGNSSCEVVFGWETKDPHAEILTVLKTFAETVRKSRDAGEKPQTFIGKLKGRFFHDDP